MPISGSDPDFRGNLLSYLQSLRQALGSWRGGVDTINAVDDAYRGLLNRKATSGRARLVREAIEAAKVTVAGRRWRKCREKVYRVIDQLEAELQIYEAVVRLEDDQSPSIAELTGVPMRQAAAGFASIATTGVRAEEAVNSMQQVLGWAYRGRG